MRDRRPSKRNLLAPAWAARVSVPAIIVRVHFGLRLLLCVCATHLCPTRRPVTAWVKVRRTLAASLRVNPNVVPTGGLGLRARCASRLPSRHLVTVWNTRLRTGFVEGVVVVAVVVACRSTVTTARALAAGPPLQETVCPVNT